MPETVAIIQGRMGSSRLPGKVLLDIAGKPMLQHVIERTRRARTLDAVVVATSSDPSDDPIASFCADMDVPCSRGSLHDVLDRYYQAAKEHNAGGIVRITADCPMIDPGLIDATVKVVTESRTDGGQKTGDRPIANPQSKNNNWLSPSPVPGLPSPVDFAANRLPPPFLRTFPIGLDVEVCSFAALQRAWQESTEIFHREHVMPYIYEDVSLSRSDAKYCVSTGLSPRGFNIALLNHEPEHGSLRWTVDTPEDLVFVREVFARLGGKADFGWYDILEILQKEPELARINSEVHHKTMTEVDERAKKYPRSGKI